MSFEVSTSFVLLQKLKELKGVLETWNMDVFRHVAVHKNEALRQITYWDALENARTLTLEKMSRREEARESFKKWTMLEEISWRRKSREVWLKGDRNTKFFHKMAKALRRKNQLGRIRINGAWFTEGQEMKEGIVSAFENLLTASGGWKPNSNDLSFDRIDPREARELEKPFLEEIFKALADFKGDKAPGPDGFPYGVLALFLGLC